MVRGLPDEKALLARVAAGDTEAFARIFEHYQPRIYTFCLPILHSEMLAEEVVQEVMLKLWRMGAGATAIEQLDGYLKAAARNRCIDLLRQQRLHARKETDLQYGWTEVSDATEEQVLLGEARRLLQEGIDRLPPQRKTVYRLAEEEGLKAEQIAQQLSLSTATVHTHLKLARKALRDYLSRYLDVAIIAILFNLL